MFLRIKIYMYMVDTKACQCHDIIMQLSLDMPARPLSCTAFAASPPLAHGTARSQRRDRQNVTMSSA